MEIHRRLYHGSTHLGSLVDLDLRARDAQQIQSAAVPMLKKHVYRVVLRFPFGVTRIVAIKARNRKKAEKSALRRFPAATQVDRSSLQN